MTLYFVVVSQSSNMVHDPDLVFCWANPVIKYVDLYNYLVFGCGIPIIKYSTSTFIFRIFYY